MNVPNKNDPSNKTNTLFSWIKNKTYQMIGLVFILLSIYLYFVLNYFDYQDYGNPYISSPKENINSFLQNVFKKTVSFSAKKHQQFRQSRRVMVPLGL